MAFTLTSPAFEAGAFIPGSYGSEGMDVSPPSEWSAPPTGIQSMALVCSDPDAPGGALTHWAIYEIPLMPSGCQRPGKTLTCLLARVRPSTILGGLAMLRVARQMVMVRTATSFVCSRMIQPGYRLAADQAARRYSKLATRHACGQAELMGRFSR
jgi:hypothetical protein